MAEWFRLAGFTTVPAAKNPVRWNKLLAVCLVLLVTTSCSSRPEPQATIGNHQDGAATSAAPGSEQVRPAILEDRLLTIDYPATIRAGDSEVIRLTFEMDRDGSGQPGIPAGEDIYLTHNVLAEARLELPGINLRPDATIIETLTPGQDLSFFWSILPETSGSYTGTIWFYLHFVPKDGSPATRKALSALPVELQVISILGIPTMFIRTFGYISFILGAIFGLPLVFNFFDWMKKQLPVVERD